MTKHRTQVLLESSQYQVLSRLARHDGVSVSEVIRRLVEQGLGGDSAPALSEICGIASGPGRSGRDHDEELYGP